MRYVPSPCGATTWASQILSNNVLGCGIGPTPGKSFFGGRGSSLALQLSARALGDARRSAGAAAQVIELGASDRPAPDHVDRGDARRIKWKDAFDTFAIGNFAQGEVGIDPGVLAGDADALEGLDALALALDDLDADAHGIAGIEAGNGPRGGKFRQLLGFQGLQ